MITWLSINVVLSLLALGYAHLNASAPHRLRFVVCFIALCGWLIPWAVVGRVAPTVPVVELLPVPAVTAIDRAAPSAAGGPAAPGVVMSLVDYAFTALTLATGIGLLLFAFASVRYARLVASLSKGSSAADHLWASVPCSWDGRRGQLTTAPRRGTKPALRIQMHVPGALTTGVLAPTVWIHESLVGHPSLPAALLHEYRHAESRDNAYLWIVTLIEKLFWWNPLVRRLGTETRRLQELGCDAACAAVLADYRDMLNRLVLSLSPVRAVQRSCPQAAGIDHGRNFNVERIRALERRYGMKTRHYASTVALTGLVVLTLSCATAQQDNVPVPAPASAAAPASTAPAPARAPEASGSAEAPQPVATKLDREVSLDEQIERLGVGPIPGLEPGISMEEADKIYRGLRLYVTLLERQWDELESQNQALRAELDELRSSIEAVE